MQDGKINIRSLLPEEISAELKAMGQPAYRAKQVFEWLTRGVESYDEMSNLPKQLRAALAEARETKGKPSVILMRTVKGRGVSFMENNAGWHGKAPNAEQYEQAHAELSAAIEKLEVE